MTSFDERSSGKVHMAHSNYSYSQASWTVHDRLTDRFELLVSGLPVSNETPWFFCYMVPFGSTFNSDKKIGSA